MKGRDIIVVGIQPWDIEIGSNCKNIAEEFAKHNRVLYVSPPTNRITFLKDRKKPMFQTRAKIMNGEVSSIEVVQEGLWKMYPKTMIESINWIPFFGLFDLFNRKNTECFVKDIKEAIEELDFKDFVLFNDSSMFLGNYLKELLNPELYVYYVRDNLIEDPYFKKHGRRTEPQVISKADVVVNNSEYYVEYSSKYNSNSFMVGQGCDVSLFANALNKVEIATELSEIQHPIIGYVGAITTLRLDVELLYHIATNRPEWNIVLVGPEDDDFKKSKLHQLENIHFLGFKPMDSLPSFIKGFDVTINPQLTNKITIGNYPRKIDEYLAMGKAVVATRTKAMEMFADHVYLANSYDEYIQLIEQALSEDGSLNEQRIEFAKSHSWENSVLAIYQRMEPALKQNGFE